MQIPFLKMEGIGNDYIFFDALYFRPSRSSLGLLADTPQKRAEALRKWLGPKQIAALSDRHYGIGGDGVVLIAPPNSSKAEAGMQMWNADGSESAICGNALRCVALHVFQKTGLESFFLESGVGLHKTLIIKNNKNYNSNGGRLKAGSENGAKVDRGLGTDVQSETEVQIRIEMGEPVFVPEQIPFRDKTNPAMPQEAPLLDHPFGVVDDLGQRHDFRVNILSMGNPHCVIFCEDADAVCLEKIGPLIENDPRFPERSNVEFVSVVKGSHTLYQRTWERGSGETLACGSGACAVAVAAKLLGLGNTRQRIRLKGGELLLHWDGMGHPVFMQGPARLVFLGNWLFLA